MKKYINIAKRLGNQRTLNQNLFLKEVLKEFKKDKYTDFKIVSNEQFPLIEKVAQGSAQGHTVMVLNESSIKDVDTILIGKGITFDSGGVQSKGDHMSDMFFDKLGAVLTISYCMSNPNVGGIIFLASNIVGPNSYVPHEIVKSRSGKKVFIDHTDAEGRLCLADLISYATELNKSSQKITIATLTGSAVRFTGENTYALLHATDKKLKSKIVTADNIDLWPAPSHKKYKESLNTKVIGADIRSLGNMSEAGSMTAYEFLRHFDNRLVHIDIAAMGVENSNYNGWGYKEIDFLVDLV